MEIRVATRSDLPAFFEYLDKQIRENGADDFPLFQPMSRDESYLNDAMRTRFTQGIDKMIGESGWRKMWLAMVDDRVVGHIDIRPHPENHTQHRALLGMGVDLAIRGQGLAGKLLNTLFDWTANSSHLEYLDLWVLSDNQAAYKLYQRNDFIKCGEVNDMFKIDGRSLSYTMMSRRTAL
ncbi:GNAT family N-acetyltransferase [Shewanella colwelliana]|uniref:GNAT family N-acetyltransferase n=1 Tax=Shewanella colwelliana TaxID=23 RepID=UPI00048AA0CD|nr:GNAT family N-acetyltransferase [Shewanella colwelliana]